MHFPAAAMNRTTGRERKNTNSVCNGNCFLNTGRNRQFACNVYNMFMLRVYYVFANIDVFSNSVQCILVKKLTMYL